MRRLPVGIPTRMIPSYNDIGTVRPGLGTFLSDTSPDRPLRHQELGLTELKDNKTQALKTTRFRIRTRPPRTITGLHEPASLVSQLYDVSRIDASVHMGTKDSDCLRISLVTVHGAIMPSRLWATIVEECSEHTGPFGHWTEL